MSIACTEANYGNYGESDVSKIEVLPNDLAKAVADSREHHNLHGPFDSAEEAVASMLKEG